MCNIIQNPHSMHNDPDGVFIEGTKELVILLDEEDDISINPSFLTKLNGKIFCKHPDSDWHEMEIKPGEGLHCPAQTELKMVLPEPYIFGSEK